MSPAFSVLALLVIDSVGVVVSMVTDSPLDAALTLPALSLALTERVCDPGARVLLVMDQTPPVAMATPSTVLSVSYRVTVEPASAVPVMRGVVTLVMWSALEVPESLPALSTGVGGVGGVSVSKVIDGVVPAPPLLPAVSV